MSHLNLCYYANRTAQIQILRVKQGQKIYWERVVFPQERIFFAAHHFDHLEIYEKTEYGVTKFENISCKYLMVVDEALAEVVK
ncbi:MAG TPA: DUF1830 domain-containing protein [Oscillatoriaceae cyanobacterium M33_DOE_052]|uniref:DUF1830 domain-containing protein n=1 Tax=Planktothricoides sp. SpSt-374 TaxID=2282167 RepID=A0A7C3ZTJ5_9CYAN|nr:DUF1830 domain-containing protein [Oscillatoriaceae cyanobacterium M33_DOE_052]